MANAAGGKSDRGDKAASQQGRAGLRLQRALPDARVVYVSATGASEVESLAYAERLGLWGSADFPFATRSEFIAAVEDGGVAPDHRRIAPVAEAEGFARRLPRQLGDKGAAQPVSLLLGHLRKENIDDRTRSMVQSYIELKDMISNIERIADHATNIAEASIYSLQGTDIRHTGIGKED